MSSPQASEHSAREFLAHLEQQARAADAGRAQLEAAAKEAYRWGRIDRRTQNFQPLWRSGDAAVYESSDLMHRRSRDQVLNNSQIKRVVDALVDLIVGPGLMTFADPFEPTMDLTALSGDSLDEPLTYALESDDLFEEWFLDPQQFDASGKRTGPEMQRLAQSECIERGGMLLVKSQSSRGHRIVPRQWQAVEYDQLDLTKDRPAGTGQHKIVHGIELDDDGRELAYHIYDDHPYDDFTRQGVSGKSSRVAADRVIHVCDLKRPSQSIGATWLAALGQNSLDRDKFIGGEIQSAAKAALLLLVHYTKNLRAGGNLGLMDDGDTADDFGNEQMKMGSSPMALRAHIDDEIELVENTRPATSCDEFINILDHDTAGAAGLSYYTMSGRYDQTSYTSVRGALLSEDGHIRPLQNWFAAKVALPMRRDFHRQAIALGKLKSVSSDQYAANPRRYNRFDAVGAGRELLDPLAENDATLGKLRGCLTTLKAECARRGLHWIRVLRQVALENRLLEVLGIVLDLSKGQGGQVIANSRSKKEQQELAETTKPKPSKSAAK